MIRLYYDTNNEVLLYDTWHCLQIFSIICNTIGLCIQMKSSLSNILICEEKQSAVKELF